MITSVSTDYKAAGPIKKGVEASSVLERVKKEADLIDIRFKDDFKVCTYRLEDMLIEVRQHRRHLEDLAVAILGPARG